MGLLVLNQNWRFSVSVVFGHDSNIVRSLIFEFFSFKTRPKNELRVRGGNIKSQINAKHLTIV